MSTGMDAVSVPSLMLTGVKICEGEYWYPAWSVAPSNSAAGAFGSYTTVNSLVSELPAASMTNRSNTLLPCTW